MKINQVWLNFSDKKPLKLKRILPRVENLDHPTLKLKIEKQDSSLKEMPLEKLKKINVNKNLLNLKLKLKQKTIFSVNLKRWITNFKKSKKIKMKKTKRNSRCLERPEQMPKTKVQTQNLYRLRVKLRKRTMVFMKLELIAIDKH
jgi:hypothetical protein